MVVDRAQSGAAEKVEIIGLTNSPWAKQGTDPDDIYVMTGVGALKMRACRKLLQIMNRNRWIPSFFGFLAARLCEREITESLLACDSDAIVCLDAQWGKQLKKLLQKKYPQWLCLTPTENMPHLNRAWRKYDPSAKVSVVLPTYNGSRYIRKSIESCLNQTHENLELIIVDDGSNENIRAVADSYGDGRIKYFRHKKNLGVASALNTGFKHATGEYLTWTSDDNYYAENAIEEMARFLQTYPDVDFAYADSFIVEGEAANSNGKIWKSKPPEWLKFDNCVAACFLYKRQVGERIGEYNPQIFLVEDYDYWVRVSKVFKMQRLFRPLYYYRFHADSLTGKYQREQVLKQVKLVKQMNKIRVSAS